MSLWKKLTVFYGAGGTAARRASEKRLPIRAYLGEDSVATVFKKTVR